MSRRQVKGTKSKTVTEASPSQEKSKNFSTLEKNAYLQEIFIDSPSDTHKLICLLCTENTSDLLNLSGTKTPQELSKMKSLLKEESHQKKLILLNKYWIRKHLETKTHTGFTKVEDRPRLEDALSTFSGSLDKDSPTLTLQTKNSDNSSNSESEDLLLEIPPLSQDMEAKLYIDMCSFLIQNHLSYEAAPLLLGFVKRISTSYHPELLERSHISSTTSKKAIKDVICASIRANLVNELAEAPYSLLMDASSDIFGGKYLAVFARYIDLEESNVATKLLKVIELETDQTGETLLHLLNEEIFLKNPRIRRNLIGISTDNGSNMVSSLDRKVDPKGSGVVNRLTKETEGLVFVRDICHCLNLVAQKSCEGLPVYIEQFVRRICSYMNSGNRNSKLKQLQKEKGVKEPLEIMDYCDTRWESLLNCTARVLHLWQHLKVFLGDSETSLKEEIKNPEYHLYVYLLYILLHRIIGYIICFQKSDLLLNQVFDKLNEAYTLFARTLLKEEYQEAEFSEAFEIDFTDQQSPSYKEKVASREIFAQTFLKKYPRVQEYINEVVSQNPKRRNIGIEALDHAREFILNALTTMRRKLPYHEENLKNSLIIYLKEVGSMNIWRGLIKDFPGIIPEEEEVDYLEELEIFGFHYKKIVSEHKDSDLNIIKRWKVLQKDYRVMWKLVRALLAIPFSTTKVESVFSEFKAVKTAPRNRIALENLEASIVCEQYFRTEFMITKDMIDRYSRLWDKTKPAVTDRAEESKTEEIISDPISQQIHPNLVQNSDLNSAIALISSLNQLIQTLASNSNLESLRTSVQEPLNPLQNKNQGMITYAKVENAQCDQLRNLLLASADSKTSKGKRKAEDLMTHSPLKNVKTFEDEGLN